MEKYVGYEKKEFKEKIERIYFRLGRISTSLAMVSQQLGGKRKNLESDYIDEDVIKDLNDMVKTLNEFEISQKELPLFNIDKIKKDLEEKAKEDIY